jgi:hypothetical protein
MIMKGKLEEEEFLLKKIRGIDDIEESIIRFF